jgi:hypothetical protein
MSQTGSQPPDRDNHRREIALAVHERAEQNAYHDDLLMWQVASITWGANTVLLGLVLAAIDNSQALIFVVSSSVVGLVLTLFVDHFWRLGKIGQAIAYEMCRHIEKEFPADLRLHSKIDEVYVAKTRQFLTGRAKNWVHGITVMFVIFWLGVLGWVIYLRYARTIQDRSAGESTTTFQKKIDCSNEGKKLEKETEQASAAASLIGEFSYTYRVFYSPKWDSCLVASHTSHSAVWKGDGPDGIAQIDDILSGRIVWRKEYSKAPSADDFEVDIEKEIEAAGLESRPKEWK